MLNSNEAPTTSKVYEDKQKLINATNNVNDLQIQFTSTQVALVNIFL